MASDSEWHRMAETKGIRERSSVRRLLHYCSVHVYLTCTSACRARSLEGQCHHYNHLAAFSGCRGVSCQTQLSASKSAATNCLAGTAYHGYSCVAPCKDSRGSATEVIKFPVTPGHIRTTINCTQDMLRQSLAVAIFVSLVYLLLNTMSDENNANPLVNIGGKQVPLQSVSKPHNVVIGGVDKPIPALDDFPPLEPTEPKPEDAAKKEN